MTTKSEERATEPLDMVSVHASGMALAVSKTIASLAESGQLAYSDWATARLALEVAERIDADGLECGISLYARLHALLQDMQGKGYRPQCPLAQTSAPGV